MDGFIVGAKKWTPPIVEIVDIGIFQMTVSAPSAWAMAAMITAPFWKLQRNESKPAIQKRSYKLTLARGLFKKRKK